jgi:hypothetical protein
MIFSSLCCIAALQCIQVCFFLIEMLPEKLLGFLDGVHRLFCDENGLMQ